MTVIWLVIGLSLHFILFGVMLLHALCKWYTHYDKEDKIKRAIDILDAAIGDTDPPVIDYEDQPMIHAMHVLLGKEQGQ